MKAGKEKKTRLSSPTEKSGFGHAFLLILIFLCLWKSFQPIPGEDIWWVMKSGQVILERGKVPHHDVFSYTAADLPWINHEWLTGVIFYLLHEIGSFNLLYAVKASMILSAFLLVTLLAYKRTDRNLIAATFSAIIMLLVTGNILAFDIRPFIFTYFFLSLSLLILNEGYYGKNPVALYLLIPITLFWVNLHGGYILSYVLQMIFLSVALVKKITEKLEIDVSDITQLLRIPDGWQIAEDTERRNLNAKAQSLFSAGIITLLFSLAAGLINPYSFEIFLYPFSFWKQDYYREHIIEWRKPVYFGENVIFTVSTIAIVLLIIVHFRKLRLTDLLIAGSFTYLAFSAVRHIPLYGIALIPVLAITISPPCKKIAQWLKAKLPVPARKILILAMLILIICVAASYFSKIEYRQLNLEYQLMPVGGVEFLKMNRIPGNMFNAYEWGGYLIWKLYPAYKVMIDGRANTVYPEQLYKEHIDTVWGYPGWDTILEKYNINFLILNKVYRDTRGQKLIDCLLKDHRWAKIYEDQVENIFIRNDEANRKIIEDARAGRLFYPMTPFYLNNIAFHLLEQKKYDEAEKVLTRALSMNPWFVQSLTNMGCVKIFKGDRDAAERYFKRALYYNNCAPFVNFNLGKLYETEGKYKKAAEHFRRELQVNPGYSPAQKHLDQLKNTR